jgi:hypothetical protein
MVDILLELTVLVEHPNSAGSGALIFELLWISQLELLTCQCASNAQKETRYTEVITKF